MLEVAQTISGDHQLAERGDEQDVVTLSTLHAAKGPGVAARAAGRRQRGPAAFLQAATTR